jgi:DNA-binding MarR family transcriptional regulator
MATSPALDATQRQDFLDRQPTYWLKRAYHALRRRVDEQLRPTGVSLSQRDALLTLRHHGPTAHGALAARLGLEQSSVSRLVESLSNRGLVVVCPAAHDRRRRVVSLTEQGGLVLQGTPGSSQLAGSILAAALSKGEREELIRLLRKCTEVLENPLHSNSWDRRTSI